jgi:Flp pilus assembly protein TadB
MRECVIDGCDTHHLRTGIKYCYKHRSLGRASSNSSSGAGGELGGFAILFGLICLVGWLLLSVARFLLVNMVFTITLIGVISTLVLLTKFINRRYEGKSYVFGRE